MKNRYPIRDIQYHEESLRETVDEFGDPVEEAIAVAWHSTAIAYLVAGNQMGLPGPGSVIDGRPVLVEDYLIRKTDSHGLTYFEPIEKPTPAKAG